MKRKFKGAVSFLCVLGLTTGLVVSNAEKSYAADYKTKTKVTNAKKAVKKHRQAELRGIKANSDMGYTRVVLELKNRQPSWDVEYNKASDTLEIVLPDTKNEVKSSTMKQRKGGVLNDMQIEEIEDGSLKISIQANQTVQHNVFALQNPDRLVIDMFTDYSQKTTKVISNDIKFTRWERSISQGRLRVLAFELENVQFSFERSKRAMNLETWMEENKAELIVPIDTLPKDMKKKYSDWYLEKNDDDWNIVHTTAEEYNGIPIEGIPVLSNGKYLGPKGLDGEIARPSSSYIGVKPNGELVVVVIEGGSPASVGATLKESSKILEELGLNKAICIGRAKAAQVILEDQILPLEMNWPKEKFKQTVSIS